MTDTDKSPASTRQLFTAGYRRPTLGIIVVLTLVAFEAYAVLTALPQALGDLGGLRWYGMAFGLNLAGGLFASVIAGGLTDRFGPLPPFLTGGLVFALGSLTVGAAHDPVVFLTGRALQGLGGGLLSVVVYVLVIRRYAEDLRPKMFAVMASAWIVPSVVGPPLAERVTDLAGWRWVFLAIAPLLVPALVALIPDLRAAAATETEPGDPPPARRLILLATGTAVGATLLQYAIGARQPVATGIGAGVALVLLVLTVPPLLPAGTLLARPGPPVFVLLRGLLAGAFFGAEVLIPLLAAAHPGGGPALGGLLLAAGSLGWAAGSWIQGHWPSHRHLISGGCLLIAAGVSVALTGLVPVIAAGWFAAGIGMGLAFATVNRLALESAEPAEQGRTSSALHVSDTVASILTTGIGATIVTVTGRFAPAFTMTAACAVVAGVIALVRTHPRVPGIRAADSA